MYIIYKKKKNQVKIVFVCVCVSKAGVDGTRVD